jgi:hypothetical protein
MITEKQRLVDENDTIMKKLANAPKGILQIRRCGNIYKWYHRTEDKDGHMVRRYLRKSESDKAKQLAAKTYLRQKLADNRAELNAINAYLKHHSEEGNNAQMIKDHPAFRRLLAVRDLDKELAAWQSHPYERNERHAQALKIRAADGVMVRSKSEAFILSSLLAAGIPHRYECRLDLGDATVYPDFMIRRPSNGELVLWEHFGMMSDPVYVQKTCEKVERYIRYGFYPMKNLITTYEHDDAPLDFSEVMDIIEWLQK